MSADVLAPSEVSFSLSWSPWWLTSFDPVPCGSAAFPSLPKKQTLPRLGTSVVCGPELCDELQCSVLGGRFCVSGDLLLVQPLLGRKILLSCSASAGPLILRVWFATPLAMVCISVTLREPGLPARVSRRDKGLVLLLCAADGQLSVRLTTSDPRWKLESKMESVARVLVLGEVPRCAESSLPTNARVPGAHPGLPQPSIIVLLDKLEQRPFNSLSCTGEGSGGAGGQVLFVSCGSTSSGILGAEAEAGASVGTASSFSSCSACSAVVDFGWHKQNPIVTGVEVNYGKGKAEKKRDRVTCEARHGWQRR